MPCASLSQTSIVWRGSWSWSSFGLWSLDSYPGKGLDFSERVEDVEVGGSEAVVIVVLIMGSDAGGTQGHEAVLCVRGVGTVLTEVGDELLGVVHTEHLPELRHFIIKIITISSNSLPVFFSSFLACSTLTQLLCRWGSSIFDCSLCCCGCSGTRL